MMQSYLYEELMHMQRTQPEQLGVFCRSARLESGELNHHMISRNEPVNIQILPVALVEFSACAYYSSYKDDCIINICSLR